MKNFNGRSSGPQQPTVPMLINLGDGLYVSPVIGQMILSMQTKPADPDRSISAPNASLETGDITLRLQFVTGSELDLNVEQAHNFLIAIGVRRPLVEVAPASLADSLKG